MFLSVAKDGRAVGLQAQPDLGSSAETAESAPGPVADSQTDSCKSDQGSGRSQEPAGVQQEGGQAGGMDKREGNRL